MLTLPTNKQNCQM